MTRLFSASLKALLVTSVLANGGAAADAGQTRAMILKRPVGQIQAMTTRPQAPAIRRAPSVQPPAGSFAGNSNGAADPDLVIEPRYNGTSGLPQTGYCGPWHNGDQSVAFYVRNTGNGFASGSVVYVGFGGGNFATVPVPALSPNQQVLRTQAIPANAWPAYANQPSVQIQLTADYYEAVDEASEANNHGQGTCLGPAS